MADLRLVTLPVPSNGMNTNAPPGKLPEGTGPLVRNFLTNRPGKLVMRGPLNREPYKQIDTNSIVTAPNIVTGVFEYNDKLMVGFTNKSEGYIPPWKSLHHRTTNVANLSEPAEKMVEIDIKAGTATERDTNESSGEVPCLSGARMEEYTYGYGYGFEDVDSEEEGEGQDTIEYNGGLIGKRPFLRWDGSGRPDEYKWAPFSGLFVKSHLNRIFVLGGMDTAGQDWVDMGNCAVTNKSTFMLMSSGTNELAAQIKIGAELKGKGIAAGTKVLAKEPEKFAPVIWMDTAATETTKPAGAPAEFKNPEAYEANTLFWSDQGGPIVDEVNYWKDNVSGLINRIVVGDDDQNDFGVALAIVNQAMIIFKRHSVWALYGYSPTTFQIKNLTKERGCIDPWSVCEVDGGVFFMSQQGFEFFDGVQFTQMDAGIDSTTGPLASIHAGEQGIHTPSTDFGRISTTYLADDFIMLTITGQTPSTGVVGKTWAGLLHTATGTWSEFTTASWASQGVPLVVGTGGGVPYAWDGRQLNPMPWITDPEAADAAGFSQVDVNLAGTSVGIPAKFWTDRIELSMPGYASQWHRFLMDYRFPNGASDAAAVNGWFVTMLGNKSDETIIAEEQVPGQAQLANTLYLNGRRWEKDVFNEAHDCRLQVEWKSSSTTAVKLAEVYDATAELSVTRQRRAR